MNEVVVDTGIFIHLQEIGKLDILDLFEIKIPKAVKDELENYFNFEKISSIFNIEITSLDTEGKKESRSISKKYDIQNADADTLVLSKKLKSILLTDDWDLRETANIYGIKVHGTVGILFRAYSKKLLKKKELKESLKAIPTRSSLYISSKIIEEALSYLKDNNV